jgi:hypothetical protein
MSALSSIRITFARLFVLLCLLRGFSHAAEATKEYQVKAVFLFRLAQFVDWPVNSFADESSPIVIGVLGDDPFGEALDLAVQGETAHNRPLSVTRFRSVSDVKACHVLFVSRSETARIQETMTALSGRSILTVSDIDEFVTRHNGMVRFTTDKNKINLRVDPEAAKAVGLVLNSRLLRMAEVVTKR